MPRFVLLEHRWDGVHYDFMLERGGMLRTWAIDAPIVPGVELTARSLPDHRPFYLDYEGAISGDRGSVRRLDAGTYSVIGWEESRVCVQLDGAQLVGEVELRQVGVSSDGGSVWIVRLGNVD